MVLAKMRKPTVLKIGDYERTKFVDSDDEDLTKMSKGQKRRRKNKADMKAKHAFFESARKAHKEKTKKGDGPKKAVKFHVSDVTKELQRLASEQEEIEKKKLAKISRATRQAMAATELQQFESVLNFKPFQSDPFGALQTHLTNSVAAGKKSKVKTLNPKDVVVSKKGVLKAKKQSTIKKATKKNKISKK